MTMITKGSSILMDLKNKFGQLHGYILIAMDILLIGLALIVFALFDHAWPRALNTEISSETLKLLEQQAQIQAQQNQQDQQQIQPTAQPEVLGAKFSDKFTDGEPYWNGDNYVGRNLSVEYHTGTMADSVYYVQDVYVRNIECLMTGFGQDTYGRGYVEEMSQIASRKNAIGAINGDFYCTGSLTVIIRNGQIYRDQVDPFESVCVLFRDGTMEIYENGEFTVQNLIERGAWQTWSFGPKLLDSNGRVMSSYTDSNSGHHPRTVIGMVEPGHYVLLVVDGRQDGYSEGMDYNELAELCSQLGMTLAYNLDGGATAKMYYRDQVVSSPSKDRDLSDIIYVTDVY